MENKKILALFILVLLAGNIFFGFGYFIMQKKVIKLQNEVRILQFNLKIVNFLKMFISIVLENKNEVSFDDRLKLENAVRDLQDKTILSQWDKFIGSHTESQAQQEVTNLIKILVNKISY